MQLCHGFAMNDLCSGKGSGLRGTLGKRDPSFKQSNILV